jgi:tetratricopeptide (TPR) repeat protein
MRSATSITVVLLALAPAMARADGPASPQARAHFKLGVDHYNAGEYDAAVAELEAAIAIVDEPDFEYVLGQAERRRGRCDRAIEAYRRFLRSGPPPAEVKVAETNILRCEEAIAKAHPPPVEPPDATPPLPPPVPPQPPPVPPVTPASTSSAGKVAGGVTAGVGVVALGVGAAFAVLASNQAARVKAAGAAHAPWTQALQDDFDGAHRDGTAAGVLLGVGGALAAAGGLVIVLSVLPAKPTPNSAVSFRAGVDPGGRVVGILRF